MSSSQIKRRPLHLSAPLPLITVLPESLSSMPEPTPTAPQSGSRRPATGRRRCREGSCSACRCVQSRVPKPAARRTFPVHPFMGIGSSTHCERQHVSSSSVQCAAVVHHCGGCARAKKNLHALSLFLFFRITNSEKFLRHMCRKNHKTSSVYETESPADATRDGSIKPFGGV